MGNVNLPTPVAVTGAVICVLAGYLLAIVTSADASSSTTATVTSYDPVTSRLCLTGEGIDAQEGTIVDGELCGTWRRGVGTAGQPHEGDSFRFVSLSAGTEQGPQGERATTVIYGEVVG